MSLISGKPALLDGNLLGVLSKKQWTNKGSASGYCIKTGVSRSNLVHSIISSRLNTKYLQPHCPLSDNIISHSVSFEIIQKLVKEYKSYGLFKPYLQTRYYDLDRVYTVTQAAGSNTKDYRVVYRNDHQVLEYESTGQTTLEYIGENNFPLDSDAFPIKKKYHHERQLVLYVLENPHFRLEIEVLLTGLDTYENRKPLMDLAITDNPAFLGSFSFRFLVKDGIVREDLNEHLELLQEIVSF